MRFKVRAEHRETFLRGHHVKKGCTHHGEEILLTAREVLPSGTLRDVQDLGGEKDEDCDK